MEIKIPYLNFYKNRHGKTFIYVRRYRHIKGIKIKAVVGSPEFYAEYAAAIAKQGIGFKTPSRSRGQP